LFEKEGSFIERDVKKFVYSIIIFFLIIISHSPLFSKLDDFNHSEMLFGFKASCNKLVRFL